MAADVAPAVAIGSPLPVEFAEVGDDSDGRPSTLPSTATASNAAASTAGARQAMVSSGELLGRDALVSSSARFDTTRPQGSDSHGAYRAGGESLGGPNRRHGEATAHVLKF